MIRTGIAVTAGALLLAGLGMPQASAVSNTPDVTAVRNVKVKTVGNCVRISWKMPKQDSGDTFGVIIRTKDGAEFHRIETYKMHTVKCGLKSKSYRVLVRQYGGSWVKFDTKMT